MADSKLTHDDYADEAESASRAGAWPQAAALWRRAADLAPNDDVKNKRLADAVECDRLAAVDVELAEIARRSLNVQTLEARGSDRLDFHDCHVRLILAALRLAYAAGQNAATQNLKKPS